MPLERIASSTDLGALLRPPHPDSAPRRCCETQHVPRGTCARQRRTFYGVAKGTAVNGRGPYQSGRSPARRVSHRVQALAAISDLPSWDLGLGCSSAHRRPPAQSLCRMPVRARQPLVSVWVQHGARTTILRVCRLHSHCWLTGKPAIDGSDLWKSRGASAPVFRSRLVLSDGAKASTRCNGCEGSDRGGHRRSRRGPALRS
jgi:hypothetical protein